MKKESNRVRRERRYRKRVGKRRDTERERCGFEKGGVRNSSPHFRSRGPFKK